MGCGLTALGKLTNHRKRICFAESNSIRLIKEILFKLFIIIFSASSARQLAG